MSTVSRLTAVAVAAVLAVAGTSSMAAASLAPPTSSPPTSSPPAAASPHGAASVGYTYWGFYRWGPAGASWSYMKVGANDPSTSASKDGSVYGFRWALVVKDSRLPRAAGSFQQLCGSTPKAAGKKRIGFVIDYGAASDAENGDPTPAPQGLCAAVDPSATVQQALLSVTDVRIGSSGLICGIHGYPSTGCGGADKAATEPPPDKQVKLTLPGAGPATSGNISPGSTAGKASGSADGGSSTSQVVLIVVGVVVILVLVGGAIVVRRRST